MISTFNLKNFAPYPIYGDAVSSLIDLQTGVEPESYSTPHHSIQIEVNHAIQATTFGSENEEEKLIWSAETSRIYSGKLGYMCQVMSSICACLPHASSFFDSHAIEKAGAWKLIWSLQSHQRSNSSFREQIATSWPLMGIGFINI